MTNTLQPVTTATGDIVDTAIDAGVFNTLVAAVVAADLEGALRSEGPFTVFAPTDAAFDKLPEGLVAKLLLPQNKEKLKELLLYHVVSGRVLAKDLKWTQFVTTLEGQSLWIRKLWGGTVLVNNARVTTADVLATNGVIHVINEVLIPKGFELEPDAPTADIVDTAIGAGAFNTLVAAAQAAELVDALRGEGPLTVFAPTDEAFGSFLPSSSRRFFAREQDEAPAASPLPCRQRAGSFEGPQLLPARRDPAGQPGGIVKWFGNVWVNFSRVTTADVLATNGVIHVINRVLIPQGFTLETNGVQFDKAGLDAFVEANDPQEAPPTKAEMESWKVRTRFSRQRASRRWRAEIDVRQERRAARRLASSFVESTGL